MVSQSDWILEVKSMKTKKIITAIIAAVLVLALLTTLFIVSINHYFDDSVNLLSETNGESSPV